MSFGQLIIGPPGAGKTTYTNAMHAFLSAQAYAARPVVCVNLDPANYTLPYPVAIDLKELIDMEEVMETFQLGPNGGLMYCMEYLEKNLSWLKGRIREMQKATPNAYFLFDLPGQVELYTHHSGMKHIVDKMTNSWGLRLTCVHLIDSHHCSDPSKFLSVLLLSLNSMTQLELPHVNILSKMDLIESMGPLEFGLDFYTDVLDLSYLLPRLKEVAGGRSHPLARKFARLNKALADLIESYNLVSFLPLAIDDQELLTQVLKVVDKANGFMYLPQVNAESGRGAQGSTTHSPTTATAAPQTAGAKTSPATSAGVAAFAAAASSSNSSKAAVAPSASSTDASAAALRQRSQLLNSVDTSQLHELNLPDIQERYLPRTTQIDAPNAPRAHASATANATAAAVATAAAPPLQIREAKHG